VAPEVKPAADQTQTDATKERDPTLNLVEPGTTIPGGGIKINRNSGNAVTDLRTTADQLDRIAQQRALDADRAAEKALQAKYDGIDPKDFRVQTGNMKKSPFDLKQGDRDVDPKTGNVMRWRAAPGNEHPIKGDWEIDHTVPGQGFKERPGFGYIGPKDTSPEGQAIFNRQRSQVITPDELERLNRLRNAQTPAEKAAASGDGAGAVPPPASAVQTSAKEVDLRNPVVANTLDAAGKDAAKESGYQPIKTINGVKTLDLFNLGRADPKENIELHEMSAQLNLLAEELTEWSMSDRIHKDVPYSYSDAATDAGIAGLGALATYATGGLAAPIAGAATVARGGRLANMVNKAYQGSKNVAKGAKEIATNPEVRAVANKNLPGVAAAGLKTGTASAGVTTGLNAASDALDETNSDSATTELERIKKLSKG
jgi:hypothetical protein